MEKSDEPVPPTNAGRFGSFRRRAASRGTAGARGCARRTGSPAIGARASAPAASLLTSLAGLRTVSVYMSIQVDFSARPAGSFRGPVPVYVQLAHLLGQRLGVEWRVGDRLPSEQALAAEMGVNRHTVRRAVAQLVADGLLSQRRGRGIVVLRSAAREVPRLVGNVEDFFSTGKGTSYRVMEFRRQPLPSEVAQRLELPDGAAGWRIDRVMLADGEVVAYLVAFIPEDVGRVLRRHDLRRETLVAILTRRAGYPVAGADQTIEAALADPHIAAMLEVAPGAPVLKIRFIFRAAGGRPVNHVTYHYRADRYVYTAGLSASAGRTGARRPRARRAPVRSQRLNEEGTS